MVPKFRLGSTFTVLAFVKMVALTFSQEVTVKPPINFQENYIPVGMCIPKGDPSGISDGYCKCEKNVVSCDFSTFKSTNVSENLLQFGILLNATRRMTWGRGQFHLVEYGRAASILEGGYNQPNLYLQCTKEFTSCTLGIFHFRFLECEPGGHFQHGRPSDHWQRLWSLFLRGYVHFQSKSPPDHVCMGIWAWSGQWAH